jgi:hypothetical protein
VHLAAIIISVALLLAGYVFFFKTLNEQFQMQHEINIKLPPTKKFEPIFWGFGTWDKFRQLQEEVLPDSPRPQRFRRYRLTAFVLFITGMLLLIVTVKW